MVSNLVPVVLLYKKNLEVKYKESKTEIFYSAWRSPPAQGPESSANDEGKFQTILYASKIRIR